jgi:hypothetical protein
MSQAQESCTAVSFIDLRAIRALLTGFTQSASELSL